VLADWKYAKGSYESHVYQLAAYMELWEHNRPETLVEFHSMRFGKGDPETGAPGGDFHHHDFTRPQMEIALKGFKNILETYQIDKIVKGLVK